MKTKVPEIRFKEFSGEWEEKLLKKDNIISDFIVPMRDKPKDLSGNIPWCRIEDFDGIYLYKSKTNQGVSSKTIKNMNLKVFPKNTLLVSCSADLGRCAITKQELITNQTFIGLVVNQNKAKVLFLYYLMINLRKILNVLSSGTTISYLSRQEFEKLKIFLPTPQEQQKIADTFSTLDNLIDAYTKKLKLLKEHKKGLLQKMFPRNGAKVPEIRFKEFSKEWEEKRLGDIGKIITGKTPKTSDSSLWNSDILFITPTDIDEKNKYQKQTERTVTKTDKLQILPEKTIVYTCIASIGKMAMTVKPSITNQQINSIIPKKDYDNEFIYYSLLNITPYIISTQANNILPIINKTEFSQFKVLIPKSYKEQQKIADTFSTLDNLIEAYTKKLKLLKEHKKGLLQKMFVE